MHSKITSLEKEKNRLESVAKEGEYTLAIVKQENDELIGTIGLYHLDQLNQIAELGILI
jgi:RimJ/RimL family protein N-acetyltransferase